MPWSTTMRLRPAPGGTAVRIECSYRAGFGRIVDDLVGRRVAAVIAGMIIGASLRRFLRELEDVQLLVEVGIA